MSNERERLAREWAESVNPKMPNEYVCAARDYILENTTPPTMADIEWDDDKHYLAGATTPDDTECVMIWSDLDLSGDIVCDDSAWRPDQLTPNGKKYELREVTDKPEHPETLTTVEDYENAPTGTVVTRKECEPWTKRDSDDWRVTGGPTSRMDYHMADSKRSVLRWGWGE